MTHIHMKDQDKNTVQAIMSHHVADLSRHSRIDWPALLGLASLIALMIATTP